MTPKGCVRFVGTCRSPRCNCEPPKARSRQMSAKTHCSAILALMQPTENARPKDGEIVCISAGLWKRIYANAKKGSK